MLGGTELSVSRRKAYLNLLILRENSKQEMLGLVTNVIR